MKRERHWIEVTIINSGVRQCIDANKIEGEPEHDFWRHTPPMDRSGQLWMPGRPDG
ncbi:hypothetical protein [uncultured Mameliella sp.]|uniref:hypothetical protein n=1 Tax=uncultured Mameliella sp. TaxID=1447087 RepID=UPI002633C2AF|nr:hypothetical protein [uncultured Mameliella sp.]